MLKIKDDVDLKELEKFGFEVIKYGETPTIVMHSTQFSKKGVNIEIYGDKIIEYNDYVFPRRIIIKSHSIKTFDLLYDLIQANLVEKVEE